MKKHPWSRRQFLSASMATCVAGCGAGDGTGLSVGNLGEPPVPDPDPEPDLEPERQPDPEPRRDPDPEPEPEPEPDPPDDPAEPPPAPDLRADRWHTAAAWVRFDADAGVGTRFNLVNPADLPMSVDLHLFTPAGVVAIQEHDWKILGPGESVHPTLEELLADIGHSGPFEGCLWIGSKPSSGPTWLGLQGFSVDWYGPGHHLASVHGMRDFGNSNHDMTWTDLVLPRVVSQERFETFVAVANGSGVGGNLGYSASPLITIASDDGAVVGEATLDPIPPYGCRLVPVSELVGGADLANGTIRVREAEVGLLAVGFVVDKKYGGFVNADHFFDRNFVDCIPLGGTNPCTTFLEPF